ncbi:MAG: P-loop NTPase fold protein, partial [Bacteroidota bacterium]
MDSIYLKPDSPTEKIEDDQFQRAPFALRIAKLIEDHPSSDSLTIGVYGKWGEGKSSVLNFIYCHPVKWEIAIKPSFRLILGGFILFLKDTPLDRGEQFKLYFFNIPI